jgi:hypothetical protein
MHMYAKAFGRITILRLRPGRIRCPAAEKNESPASAAGQFAF